MPAESSCGGIDFCSGLVLRNAKRSPESLPALRGSAFVRGEINEPQLNGDTGVASETGSPV